MTFLHRARAGRLILSTWAGSAALAAAPAVPPIPPGPANSQPGVSIAFTSLGSGARDFRHDRLLALAVPAGTPPTSLLPAGAFRAEIEADLAVPLRGDATFSFAGTGAAELSVNGRVVFSEAGPVLGGKTSSAVQLNKGANHIQVRYTPPAATEDARFRLLWSGKDFGAEPLPPTLLSTDAGAPALREAERIRAGRELFASLHCAECHDAGAAPGPGMPELLERAPSLADARARFRPEWIAQWILEPKAQRAGARMPRVHLDAPGDAADIAAYLTSIGNEPAAVTPPAAATISAGGRLFVELRCIACHTEPGEATATAAAARLSLSLVPAKWQPAALADYLRDPRKLNESARMPDFHLSAAEATQLAAYLIGNATPPAGPIAGNATRGQGLFSQSCLPCHAAPVAGPARAAGRAGGPPSLQDLLARNWERGCLGADAGARGAAPDFGLDAAQRDALRAFAAAGAASLRQDAPVESAARAFAALRCAACHDRDGRPAGFASLGAAAHALELKFAAANRDEAEAQSVEENPPSLTWAGEKLNSPWLRQQVAGDLKARARPWLKVRMPGFGPRADVLARGLALEHGEFPTAAESPHEVDPDLAETGARLAGADFFSCTTCHAAGSTPALAPFGTPGINFAVVPDRLRYEYYLRWLDNPQRVDPAARMPRFTGENGKSLQTGILDGDAHAQWDAIREYLFQVMIAENPDRK